MIMKKLINDNEINGSNFLKEKAEHTFQKKIYW